MLNILSKAGLLVAVMLCKIKVLSLFCDSMRREGVAAVRPRGVVWSPDAENT